jgi:hypothetical protein
LPGKNLDAVLAPITLSLHRFGCATVYEIASESQLEGIPSYGIGRRAGELVASNRPARMS